MKVRLTKFTTNSSATVDGIGEVVLYMDDLEMYINRGGSWAWIGKGNNEEHMGLLNEVKNLKKLDKPICHITVDIADATVGGSYKIHGWSIETFDTHVGLWQKEQAKLAYHSLEEFGAF